ncbi:MAG: hypothetical protein MR835_00015 [Erysipelotrichaceae bacterium]|nr:hypothetical protein [Erysipelotrichaceae bacterium]
MSRWEGPIDFEKYYGARKYKEIQTQLAKKDYSKKEKLQMSMDMIKLIQEKDFNLYHDFMDYISENEPDWFNMLTFDRKENKFILEYIKSKAISKYR